MRWSTEELQLLASRCQAGESMTEICPRSLSPKDCSVQSILEEQHQSDYFNI